MPDLRSVDVLLVEDTPADAEMTMMALRAKGLGNRIDWVKDGAEALDYLRGEGTYAGCHPGRPRVVMLDLKLPKLDGLEVLREMKNCDELKTIPVVMVTSSAEESDLVASYKLGVNSYVVKPVDFDSFSTEISRLGLYWLLTNRLPNA